MEEEGIEIPPLIDENNPNAVIYDGMNSLQVCVELNLGVDLLRRLIDKGGKVNAFTPTKRRSPLMIAVSNTLPEYVEALLEKGADPNFTDDDGLCALYNIYREEMFSEDLRPKVKRIMRMLLDSGTNPNFRPFDTQCPVLFFITTIGDRDLVKMMVDAGADPAQLTAHNMSLWVSIGMSTDKPYTAGGPNVPLLLDYILSIAPSRRMVPYNTPCSMGWTLYNMSTPAFKQYLHVRLKGLVDTRTPQEIRRGAAMAPDPRSQEEIERDYGILLVDRASRRRLGNIANRIALYTTPAVFPPPPSDPNGPNPPPNPGAAYGRRRSRKRRRRVPVTTSRRMAENKAIRITLPSDDIFTMASLS